MLRFLVISLITCACISSTAYGYTGCNIDTQDYVWEDVDGMAFLEPCDQYNMDDPSDPENHRIACFWLDFKNGCVALVCCGAENGVVYCVNEELVCTNDNPPQVNHLSYQDLTKCCYMLSGDAVADICMIVCPEGVATPPWTDELALLEAAKKRWAETSPANTWDETRSEQCNCP